MKVSQHASSTSCWIQASLGRHAQERCCTSRRHRGKTNQAAPCFLTPALHPSHRQSWTKQGLIKVIRRLVVSCGCGVYGQGQYWALQLVHSSPCCFGGASFEWLLPQGLTDPGHLPYPRIIPICWVQPDTVTVP